jgi:serine/threonine-protein kinase
MDVILNRNVFWWKSAGAPVRPAPPPEEVRAHLETVLASRRFRNSGVQNLLLRHMVERTLAGDRGALDEASIAAAVFARPATFDPRVDPVVQLVTSRLRGKLLEYYAGRGRHDRLRIVLPKGLYAPLIVQRHRGPRRGSRGLWWAVAAVVACVAGAVPFLAKRQKPVVRYESLAVLPFQNAVGRSDPGFYGQGVAGDLAAALGRIGGPRVTAPFSAARFPDRPADFQKTAGLLGVDAFLTGNVYPHDGQAEISVELLDRAGGRIWRGHFDESADVRLPAVEGGIVRAVARALGFSPGSAATPAHVPSVEARQAFWSGRALLTQGIERRPEARDSLKRATLLDTDYPEAFASLAGLCAQMALQPGAPRQELAQEAVDAARRAIALDNSQPVAHAALAVSLFYFDGNWKDAEGELQRAIALDPNDSWVRRLYAGCLAARGSAEDSIREIQTARKLDPLSFDVAVESAMVYYYAHKYDGAIAEARTIPKADPAYAWSLLPLGSALAMKGALDEAGVALREAVQRMEGSSAALGRLSAVLAAQGERRDAIRLAEEAAASGAASAQRVHAAYGYAALGNTDRALDALEAACLKKEPDLVFLVVEPLFRDLRENPRFLEIMRKMGWY